MFDRKAYRKQYYQQHRQLEIDRARKWCLDHPEERKAWKRAAWAKNKYVNRAKQRKYVKQKKLTDYYKRYFSISTDTTETSDSIVLKQID